MPTAVTIIPLLLQFGAHGVKPLHLTAVKCNLDAMRILITECGCKADLRDLVRRGCVYIVHCHRELCWPGATVTCTGGLYIYVPKYNINIQPLHATIPWHPFHGTTTTTMHHHHSASCNLRMQYMCKCY